MVLAALGAPTRTRRWLPWAFALALLHASGFAAEAVDLDVPAGPLADALLEVGRSYGVVISFSPALVSRRSAAAVRGHWTLAEALDAALLGSGLKAQVMPDGTVTLGEETVDAAPPEPVPAAPPVPPAQDAGGPTQHVVIVAAAGAESARGPAPASTDSATMTDTPLSDIPQAVSTVTGDMLELTGARSLNEALDYVVGASLQNVSIPQAAVAAKLRGMPAQYAVDGLPSASGTLFPLDSAILEQIDVLKGPAGVVGGVSDSGGRGGVIEARRKRPQADEATRFFSSIDSADGGRLRAGIDLARGTPALSWRVAAEEARGMRNDAGYAGARGHTLLAAATGRAGDLEATLVLQHDRHREPPPPEALLVIDTDGTTMRRVSDSAMTAIAADDATRSTLDSVELDTRWRLAPHWQLKAASRWEWGRLDLREHSFSDVDKVIGSIILTEFDLAVRQSVHRLTLTGAVETGPVAHTLLAGVDTSLMNLYESDGGASWSVDPATFVPGVTALDVPVDGTVPGDAWQQPPLHRRQDGAFVQDQVAFGDLRARLGLRRAAFREELAGSDLRRLKGWSWDAGISYRLLAGVTAYVGTQSALEADYRTPSALLVSGVPAPLSRVRQAAAGLKVESSDRRLSGSIEAFRLEERDILEVIDDGGENAVVPGRQARGVEAEAAGRVTPRLDLSLGLSWVDAQDIASTISQSLPVRMPPTAVPPRSMYLLARYLLPDEIATATHLGMGLRAHSSMWAVAPDPDGLQPPYRIPGGALFDLFWKRDVGPWTFGATVRNVFDRRLYGADMDPSYVTLVPRRSLGLTLVYAR